MPTVRDAVTTELAALAPVVTPIQRDLIRRTIAHGATDDELQLYFYDCARQGIHPLDKLLFFTKRGGKYTPVTSIDLMRTRAAETNEYAGSDDAEFERFDDSGPPMAATVRVWRLTQGQRFSYTATARWTEYFPGELAGQLWLKMPHTMLAKCAEALALRKAFPRQLAGLYAAEELEQADHPASAAPTPPPAGRPVPPTVQPARVSPAPAGWHVYAPSDLRDGTLTPPIGTVFILEAQHGAGKALAFIRHTGQPAGTDPLPVYKQDQASTVKEACEAGLAVILTTKISAAGRIYLEAIEVPRLPGHEAS
jgi:phage recombination protein Bet